MTTITRFAPSPTGPLHIGGARTALFNYLHAKNNSGKFRLRIEDTDKNRNSIESQNSILESLTWLGIKLDGEIIYQSKNYKNHLEAANALLSKGLAYKCYHDREYLNKQHLNKGKFISEWREKRNDTPKNRPYCIRIKAPLNKNEKLTIKDKIQGDVSVNYNEIDDYIIVRDNGTPTFLLSSAIDDYKMKITNIIRGDDHLTNSFRQKLIFDFINYNPDFSHMSLIHNENNQKMSKRDKSTSILEYKNKGYLPEAIINYLIRLGWSYGDQEIFSMEEAKRLFSIDKLGKSPAKFDQKKLNFLNNYYIKNKSNSELSLLMSDVMKEKRFSFFSKENKIELIELFKERALCLDEIKNNILILIKKKLETSDDQKHIFDEFKKYKKQLLTEFSGIVIWNEVNIEGVIKNVVENHQIPFKSLAQPIRLSLTGSVSGPSLYKIIKILGKEETIQRIKDN